MSFGKPIPSLIRQRYSCRTYQDRPIAAEKRQALAEYLASLPPAPLGPPARFQLISVTEQDRSALRGLGTYGFIRGAAGFFVGAVQPGPKDMEGFGYLMEQIVLYATALDLGTCWLGGTFTKSTFAQKIALREGEVLPAVVAVGHIAGRRGLVDRAIRGSAQGDRRFPWERLFFEQRFGQPLTPEAAGDYAVPLEMVRLAPSASNKQPWRVVKDGDAWHFFVQRTPGYTRGLARAFVHGDLQRIDVGIAMSHWDLTTAELRLPGQWVVREPAIAPPGEPTEYIATWMVM
jgi:hypothetical protein